MTKSSKPRILFAEDEESLAAGIRYNLEKRNYEVTHVTRGDEAVACAHEDLYDLLILDVMMPGLDGFSACEQIRASGNRIPILILTARSEIENRVHGLKLGADDYLGKPFNLEELLARVEVLLRRRNWEQQDFPRIKDTRASDALTTELSFDENLLLLVNRKDGRKVQLTAMEAKLLALLIEEHKRTVSRADILEKVWGLRAETQTRTLDNFIMRLRHHFETIGGEPKWIESVRGVGYRLNISV